jgi:hypothetical protein
MQRTAKMIGVALMVCLGIVVAPAAASASALYSEGSLVPVGTQISGNSTGSLGFEAGGNSGSCVRGSFSGVVQAGTRATVQINEWGVVGNYAENKCLLPIAGSRFEGNVSIQGPQCLAQTGSMGSWTLRAPECGGPQQSMHMTWTFSFAKCEYSRSPAFNLTGNQNSQPLVLSLAPQAWTLESGSKLCSLEPKMTVNLELTTAAGKGLELR